MKSIDESNEFLYMDAASMGSIFRLRCYLAFFSHARASALSLGYWHVMFFKFVPFCSVLLVFRVCSSEALRSNVSARSPFCNTFKVAILGRDEAIAKYPKALTSDGHLRGTI